jgi:hypothetical protein
VDQASDAPIANALAEKRVRHFSAVEFLIVLVVWLISASFVLDIKYGDLIETVIASLVLLSAVVAVGARRTTLITAVVLVLPALVGKWLNHSLPHAVPREVYTTSALVFMAFVVAHLLRFVIRARQVDTQVLCAAVSIFLLLAILWSFAYMLVAEFVPGSFLFTAGSDTQRTMAGFEALYFSFGALTTLGYGDITPVSRVARSLAMAEATVSLFYVAVMIARLVSLYPGASGTADVNR